MSFKLYELTEMYKNIWDLVEDEEVDLDTLELALSQVEDNIEIKAENMAKLIKSIEGDVEFIKSEETRLAGKRRALENKQANIKQYLENQLTAMKMDKVSTPIFTVAMQNNPPSVNILDESLIPRKYIKVETTETVSKKDILEDLKQGLIIGGAEIKQGRSLRIR